jgi:hypothetical protein
MFSISLVFHLSSFDIEFSIHDPRDLLLEEYCFSLFRLDQSPIQVAVFSITLPKALLSFLQGFWTDIWEMPLVAKYVLFDAFAPTACRRDSPYDQI